MSVLARSMEMRVLVLALTNKDAALSEEVLNHAGIESCCCLSLGELAERLDEGAAAVLLPEEAVLPGAQGGLARWLAGQPSWSDLPVLVFARTGADSSAVAQAMDQLGNVTVLERPMRVSALVSAVRAALRARARQYETREYLAERERSERDLRDFFDNAAIGLHWGDPDGVILRANQTELDMLGYEREEYVGRNIADFHLDANVINDILMRLHRGETVREYEARLRCRSGSIKHVLINSNVHWDDGKFIHSRCFTRDITDRKEAERVQSLLAAIVASSDDAIVSMTLEGTILTWNEGAQRLLGYSANEMIGHPISILIPPERRDEEIEILRRLRLGERIEHFETVRMTKDGRRLDVSLTESPIRDAEGKIVGASKVARDISPRKQAEESLRAAREQLQVVTDNMAVAVTQCNRDHRYIWVSPGCAAWLGKRVEEIIGRLIPEILGQAAYEAILPRIERVLTGERVEFEAEVPYEGIGPRWINGVYVPTRDSNGTPNGWVAVISDVTSRRKMEQALRDADRRKDEFLAVLAHELRNPLAPIRNSVHILRLTSRHDPAAKGIGEMIERQVDHMVRLIDDLMEVSRITRGKIELRKETVELGAVLQCAVETSQPVIESGGHQLIQAIPEEPLQVDGDPVRLTQVFANLLNNAAKYTYHGGQIWLSVRREVDRAAISVRDNGMGIPHNMLPRIFDLFTQVDRTAARAQGGLGIGLTLVKSLVEMHGGTVEVQSEGEGQGSEFIVRLPLVAANPCEFRTSATGKSAAALSPQRILVVDDNRDAASSLGMLLNHFGADVRVVYNGRDALAAMASYQPAAVLLDVGMPEMDGLEVARRIREQPRYKEVVLIALTGWGQDEDRRISQAAGFDFHFTKPADVGALESLLRLLDSRTTHDVVQ